MPFIPARPLILALLVPVALAIAAIVERDVIPAMLAVDGIIVALALIDMMLARKPAVTVTRHVKTTLSLARSATVTLEIRNLSRRRLTVRVQDALFGAAETEGCPVELVLEAGVVRRGAYRLRAMQRGLQTIGSHHVRYASPGGLWTRQLELPAETKLRVYPDVQAVRHYELLARQNRDHFKSRLTRMRGGDTEFERLRDYLPDDEFKRIDWKASARRRKLTVREYQLERNQNIIFMLDCGRTMTAVWDGLTALDCHDARTKLGGEVADIMQTGEEHFQHLTDIAVARHKQRLQLLQRYKMRIRGLKLGGRRARLV